MVDRNRFAFWDIEAPLGWDKAERAAVIHDNGNHEIFRGPRCVEMMARHCRRARGSYFSHYGGGFDTLHMLNVWPLAEIQLSGSIVRCAQDSEDMRFMDSFPWWLNSLENVGKAVGIPKLKCDRARLHLLTSKELDDYVTNDCAIGREGVFQSRKFLTSHGAKLAETAGGSAVNLVRACEPGTWAVLRENRVEATLAQEFLENSNNGARVECWIRGQVDPVYCYDIKSSYPARYAKRSIGVGLRRALPGEHKNTIWRCRWNWQHRNKIPPALDRNTMAGVGPCENWLIDEEIELFAECGVEVQKIEGWSAIEDYDVAQVFAEMLYLAKEGTGPEAFFAKVWLNSWHGKLMMKAVREKFTRWRPSKWWGGIEPTAIGLTPGGEALWYRYFEISIGKDGCLRPFQQPLTGALILGRARCALWRIINALQKDGWRVYYSDTDSVHTNCPPEKMPVPLGKGLGQLNYEGGPYTGIYLGPKGYLIFSDEKIEKQALKGVPLKAYADGLIDSAGAFAAARLDQKGTDLRKDVFRAALNGGAHCRRMGLQTFLTGIQQCDDDERPTWNEVKAEPRLIRPTSRGKITNNEGFAYLSPLELSAREMLKTATRGKPVEPGEERKFMASRGFVDDEGYITAVGRNWLFVVTGETIDEDFPDKVAV